MNEEYKRLMQYKKKIRKFNDIDLVIESGQWAHETKQYALCSFEIQRRLVNRQIIPAWIAIVFGSTIAILIAVFN